MIERKSVGQMLADIGMPTDGDFNGSNRPPHPASMQGPLIDWCKLSAEEQLYWTQEKLFEKRLAAEVRKRHEAGWHSVDLQAYASRRRRHWRLARANDVPESIRKKEDPYVEHHAAAAAPMHWGPDA